MIYGDSLLLRLSDQLGGHRGWYAYEAIKEIADEQEVARELFSCGCPICRASLHEGLAASDFRPCTPKAVVR